MITITGALVGVAVSFAGLALAVFGLVLRVGKLIGKLESGMLQNKADIGNLWAHQRAQDIKICTTERAIERIDANIEWIKDAIEKLDK